MTASSTDIRSDNGTNRTIRSEKIKKMKSLKTSGEERASRNITIIVMSTCFLYIFGTTPYVLAYIFRFIFEYTVLLHNYTMFSMCCLFLAHGTNFFVYIAGNCLYRKVLFSYFGYSIWINRIFQMKYFNQFFQFFWILFVL